MQLCKQLFRRLVIVLPIMIVSACSSYKRKESHLDNIETMTSKNVKENTTANSNFSTKEQIRLQVQQLQKNNTVYFDLDKYNIRSNFTEMLDAHAKFLCINPSYRVTIEGHADERGTPEYNIALGERRANTVKMYLQSKGVLADQISTISYGKEKPAVLGHSESAYAKNRRGVLIY